MVGRSGAQFQTQMTNFSLPTNVRTEKEPTKSHVHGVTPVHSQGQSGRNVNAKTHPHLVPR